MNKERYVSYNIAKLLKEKGFDWECNTYWGKAMNGSIVIGFEEHPVNFNKTRFSTVTDISAPTQQMAIDWLEEWGIIVEIGGYSVDTNGNPHYGWCVLNKKAQYLVLRGQYYEDSRNEAVEAALKYVLENLI